MDILLFLMSLRVVCRIVLQGHSLELAVAVAGYMCLIVFAFHPPHLFCFRLLFPHFVFLRSALRSGFTISIISAVHVCRLSFVRVA